MKPIPKRITVLTAINNDYALPLAVMLRTLADSLPGNCSVDVRMMTTGLGKDVRNRLDRSLAASNLDLTEIKIDSSPLAGLKVTGHISIETYFRLLAPSLFPDVGRILYLDADLIVRHPILELYGQPLDGAHVLAVPHASKKSAFFSSKRGVPSYALLGIPGNTRTFNAGVMILDLDRWRQTDATREILSYLREYKDQVLWWDQDGLNSILHDKWLPLPAKWNVMSSHFESVEGEASVLDSATYAGVRADPGIIHYSSSAKPWMPSYNGPFLEHWSKAVHSVAPFFNT